MIKEHLTTDGRVWDRTVVSFNSNEIFDVHFGGEESDYSEPSPATARGSK